MTVQEGETDVVPPGSGEADNEPSDADQSGDGPPPDGEIAAVDRPGRLETYGIRAVMLFGDDPAASCRWWADVLGLEPHSEGPFFWLDTAAGVELGFHPSDDGKNPFGCSTVPYWQVRDVDQAVAALEGVGARRHRGPLRVDGGRRIAQVVDPFGVVMGVDGP